MSAQPDEKAIVRARIVARLEEIAWRVDECPPVYKGYVPNGDPVCEEDMRWLVDQLHQCVAAGAVVDATIERIAGDVGAAIDAV